MLISNPSICDQTCHHLNLEELQEEVVTELPSDPCSRAAYGYRPLHGGGFQLWSRTFFDDQLEAPDPVSFDPRTEWTVVVRSE